MLGSYCSADKITRIMFIVTVVSVIHYCVCSSTNQNSACCHPPPSVYNVTQSYIVRCNYTWSKT